MSEKLILSIVTPEKLLVSEEVDQVNVPGSEGDMGILYDHPDSDQPALRTVVL